MKSCHGGGRSAGSVTPRNRRSCRASKGCIFVAVRGSPFGQGGDGHGLVVKLALGRRGKRGDFAVGVEAGEGGAFAEDGADAFDFFLGALLEDEFSADATDEDGEV